MPCITLDVLVLCPHRLDGNLVPISKMNEVWPVAVMLPVACILLAWLCWRFYDYPLRRYFMKASRMTQHKASNANSDESM